MDETIFSSSPIGQRLESIKRGETCCILFQGKKISLVAKVDIGRDRDNDIVIDNKLVSRFHARVQKLKAAYYITDLGSANGTFVNGTRIEREKYYRIAADDIVKIANTELKIIS